VTRLGLEIRAMIEADGPLTVERYMSLCLQHSTLGYYTTRDAIGRTGDFITAPEVDQMFGELIGLWAAQAWIGMGAPPVVRFVELGPGRGTLMADALRATRIVPGFHEAARVDLVETSPRLRAEQRDKLEGAATHLAWYPTIADLPPGPAIILANEFFDALPVRHYLRGESGWHERLVGLGDDGALRFGAAHEPISIEAAAGTPGQILEVGHAAIAAMKSFAARLVRDGGAMLVCDYGHAATAIGETLQALARHAYADPLAAPGEADLTTHVDFAALARAATDAGAKAHGPIAQGAFLGRLGIHERAAALKRRADTAQAEAIDAALARFTAPTSSMATLFKAMAITSSAAPVPPGFEDIR
jgi:NADH dehydrogenase [ubiquinone] 1 alpha subcomplex assembly factor 7